MDFISFYSLHYLYFCVEVVFSSLQYNRKIISKSKDYPKTNSANSVDKNRHRDRYILQAVNIIWSIIRTVFLSKVARTQRLEFI